MKKVVFFVIIIISIFIINNFFHSIYRLWQKQDVITEVRNELAQAKKEQQSLKKQLQSVENPSFIEEEARNKLFLVKPGEEIVVLPSQENTQKVRVKSPQKPLPAWEQWYKLFF